MIERMTIKEDVYEQVIAKVGEKEKNVWKTSDGLVWDDEKSAQSHEFYELKVKKRHFSSYDNVIMDCDSIDDIKHYLKDYGYNVTIHNYNESDLTFPNTYVLIERTVEDYDNGVDDDWGNFETYLDIITLNEFKNKIVAELNTL